MTISTTPQANALSPEHGPRSGFANFRSIVIGRLFSALSVWLAIVALTKMSDPATVGMYALAQAICIPIAEVSKMSLREVRSSDHSGQFVFGDYLGLRLLAVLVALALMMLFGFLQSLFGGAAPALGALDVLLQILDAVLYLLQFFFGGHRINTGRNRKGPAQGQANQ